MDSDWLDRGADLVGLGQRAERGTVIKTWKLQAALLIFLAAIFIPLLHRLGLPARIDFASFAGYLRVIALQSLIGLFGLYLIQRPQLVAAGLRKAFHGFPEIALFMLLGAFLWWRSGGRTGMFCSWLTIALAVVCLYQAGVLERLMLHVAIKRMAGPAALLAGGLIVVFVYGATIAVVRPFSGFDSTFLHIDRLLLFGHSISELSHTMLRPPLAGSVFESIYYGLFPILGGVLIWLAFEGEAGASLSYVRDLVSAYLISLAVYFIVPAIGPFFFDRTGAAALGSYRLQMNSLNWLDQVHAHHDSFFAGAAYFIAFPSMHLAQSLLVVFNLRRWPRLFKAATIYNSLLVVSIVALKWHYAIDLLGGLVVAFAAVNIPERLTLHISSWRPQIVRAGIVLPSDHRRR